MQTLTMLKKTDEFSSVFTFKKRFSTTYFVVHYKPNATQKIKVGFVVAKKVAKHAVDRNYMRRVLREFCRHHLPNSLGLDAVIQVKKKFVRQEFTVVNQELSFIFDHLHRKLKDKPITQSDG